MDFKPLDDAKKSKYTTYIRCMKDKEVKWTNTNTERKVVIPSHYIVVMQNNKGAKKNPVNNFNKLVDKYWKDN